jgi:dynamin-binding protein
MNMSYAGASKSRPPPALLDASRSYVALRAQLARELPDYAALLHRGLVAVIRKWARWQTEFWNDVRTRWAELWEALRASPDHISWRVTHRFV